ncbi:hypothetical protein VTL71DRAFT_12452 [Oculimacula yallundae]|uniref:Uncharacterized protein n=1 Tax=Oculimacula yallundae TaxID=86028 RepID=A0ABR4CN43_9HELO
MKFSNLSSGFMLASTVSAAGRYCSWPTVYKIDSQEPVFTQPELVGGVFVGPSSTVGTINAGYAFTKSESITGSISGTYAIPGIGSVGVSTSYGVTTARGTSLTVSVQCPINIQCGITASTYVLRVKGTMTMYSCGASDKNSKQYPCQDSAPSQCPSTAWNTTFGAPHAFTVDYPIAASASNVGSLMAVNYNPCYVNTPYQGMAKCPPLK